MTEVNDRRKTGIHRTKIRDGNGVELDLVTVTAKKVKVVAGAITAVLMVLASVFAAVRLGVVTEVHKAIEVEAMDEEGAIHRVIHTCAEEYIGEVQGVIQDDLDMFERRIDDVEDMGVLLKAGQEAISSQQDRNQDELKMLIQRAIEED